MHVDNAIMMGLKGEIEFSEDQKEMNNANWQRICWEETEADLKITAMKSCRSMTWSILHWSMKPKNLRWIIVAYRWAIHLI